MATYLEQSLAKLEQFEGSIPWMYVDTAGRVTVGVGLMLANAEAATRLRFHVSGRPASEAEITAEYHRVAAQPMGRPAGFYHREGAPELPQTEIDSLLRTVLTGFEGELRGHLPAYDDLPDGVKMALLDMAYNLGPAGLLHGYPKLIRAVETGAWAQAASASFRHGPATGRNEWTRNMFLTGIGHTLRAESESFLRRLGYGLLGAGATLWENVRRER